MSTMSFDTDDVTDFVAFEFPDGRDRSEQKCTCVVCLEIPVRPVHPRHDDSVRDCGVLLCARCYDNWRLSALSLRNDANNSHHDKIACPKCRAPCDPDLPSEFVTDGFLRQFLADMPSVCKCCGFKAGRSDVEFHVRTEHPDRQPPAPLPPRRPRHIEDEEDGDVPEDVSIDDDDASSDVLLGSDESDDSDFVPPPSSRAQPSSMRANQTQARPQPQPMTTTTVHVPGQQQQQQRRRKPPNRNQVRGIRFALRELWARATPSDSGRGRLSFEAFITELLMWRTCLFLFGKDMILDHGENSSCHQPPTQSRSLFGTRHGDSFSLCITCSSKRVVTATSSRIRSIPPRCKS